MNSIKKILVPTDLSELSLSAITVAKSLANVYQARIYLLHAVDVVPVVAFPTVDFTYETAMQVEAEKAQARLHAMAVDHFTANEDVRTVVRQGLQYNEILKFADEEGIDLIVMATHGRTGLAHILMGSVAEKVVQHSPIPVLTVKPQSMKTSTENIRREHEIHT